MSDTSQPVATPTPPAPQPTQATETERAVAEINALVDEIGRIASWESTPVADNVRSALGARRRDLTQNLAQRLTAITRQGGRLALVAHIPETLTDRVFTDPVAAQADGGDRGRDHHSSTRTSASSAIRSHHDDSGSVGITRPSRPVSESRPYVTPYNQGATEPQIVRRGAPATLESLAELRSGRPPADPMDRAADRGPASHYDEPHEPVRHDWRPQLVATLAGLQSGRDDLADLDRVHVVVANCQEWVRLPNEAQRNLIGHVAARLRALQDRGLRDRRIDQCFLTLTAYSARERPGFVMGLNRSHRPSRPTWQEDADAFWDRLLAALPEDAEPQATRDGILNKIEKLSSELDKAPEAARGAVTSQIVREIRAAVEAGVASRDARLVKLAAPFSEQLVGREFRLLKRSVREELESMQEEQAEIRGIDIPADWQWWPRCRGRRAQMVGGSPREANRERVQKAFDFASLDWVPADHRRQQLLALRAQIRSGTIDLLIILRSFVGHDADEILLPACREAGVDWVHVEQGSGIVRIKSAIERFLDPNAPVALPTAVNQEEPAPPPEP